MKKVAILVSPAAIDGYPPVQHQARLLAQAGYLVEIITSPLAWGDRDVRFQCQGSVVHVKALRPTNKVGAVQRAADFVSTLAAVRRKHGAAVVVEIAYDPLGMLYSDVAPFRSGKRIAHFHETLERFDKLWLEQRLAKNVHDYDLVVVPDENRGEVLARQLNLAAAPLVAPNFPMIEPQSPSPASPRDDRPFEVIYCGSIGEQQKIDVIVESVELWPVSTVFSILGNNQSPLALRLRERAIMLGLDQRVHFEGWVPFERLCSRLEQARLGISLLDGAYEQWRTALGASNKRYQYMQAGLPQIGDMNPGVKDMLEGGRIGRSVEAFTPKAVAAVVSEYVADPERCRREGETARSMHLDRYNYQRSFAPVLAWIADQAGRPRGLVRGHDAANRRSA